MTGIVIGHSFVNECWLQNEMMQLRCLCCIPVTAAKHTGTTIQLIMCASVCKIKCLTDAYDLVIYKNNLSIRGDL